MFTYTFHFLFTNGIEAFLLILPCNITPVVGWQRACALKETTEQLCTSLFDCLVREQDNFSKKDKILIGGKYDRRKKD